MCANATTSKRKSWDLKPDLHHSNSILLDKRIYCLFPVLLADSFISVKILNVLQKKTKVLDSLFTLSFLLTTDNLLPIFLLILPLNIWYSCLSFSIFLFLRPLPY